MTEVLTVCGIILVNSLGIIGGMFAGWSIASGELARYISRKFPKNL